MLEENLNPLKYLINRLITIQQHSLIIFLEINILFLYCNKLIINMKKINYLFTGILATAILFAGCSTQTKYTAFGGGWGMEKNKGFQNPNPTATNTNEAKNQGTSTTETITVNEVVAQNESKLTPEFKSYVATHKAQIHHLGNKSISTSSTILLKNPSNQKIPNLFSTKNKTKSATENGDDSPAFGIASLACSFLGLFFAGIILGILGIVFGALGLKKRLRGLAIAGLILGIIDLLMILFLLLFLAAMI
jgi:hypothetical protein